MNSEKAAEEKEPSSAQPSLETVIDAKVKPLLDDAMQRYLGVRLEELRADITDKLRHSPLLDYALDDQSLRTLTYRQARDLFRKRYFSYILRAKLGNVSEASKVAGVDRRSIHRAIVELRINVHKVRGEMLKLSYLRQEAVKGIIEGALTSYHTIIVPEKLAELYKQAPELSREIVKELPEQFPTLDAAEEIFMKGFLEKVLALNRGNIAATSRQLKIRYETLYRKAKGWGLLKKKAL